MGLPINKSEMKGATSAEGHAEKLGGQKKPVSKVSCAST